MNVLWFAVGLYFGGFAVSALGMRLTLYLDPDSPIEVMWLLRLILWPFSIPAEVLMHYFKRDLTTPKVRAVVHNSIFPRVVWALLYKCGQTVMIFAMRRLIGKANVKAIACDCEACIAARQNSFTDKK